MGCLSVSTNLHVSVETTYRVISNLQLLLRLSPHWDLISLTPVEGNSIFEVVIKLYADNTDKRLLAQVAPSNDFESYAFTLKDTITKKVEFTLKQNHHNSIEITQKYHIENVNDASILETLSVELKYWHRAIIEYIKLQEGSGLRKVFFRWFMDKIWLRLKLSERKIAIIIAKITILEILVLIMLIIGWRVIQSFK